MNAAIRSRTMLWLLTLPAGAAFAADKAGDIAAAVPVEVSELVSGGTWSENGRSGFYRAMVITPGGGASVAVVVQRLWLESEQAVPQLAGSVPIKGMAEQSFASAVLAMDAETENEMTLIVTAFGSGTDQDTAMQFKFDGAGNYVVVPVTAEPGDGAAGDPAEK
jgi:hypothetical protein